MSAKQKNDVTSRPPAQTPAIQPARVWSQPQTKKLQRTSKTSEPNKTSRHRAHQHVDVELDEHDQPIRGTEKETNVVRAENGTLVKEHASEAEACNHLTALEIDAVAEVEADQAEAPSLVIGEQLPAEQPQDQDNVTGEPKVQEPLAIEVPSRRPPRL